MLKESPPAAAEGWPQAGSASAESGPPVAAAPVPQPGTAAQFSRLRALLEQAGYTAQAVRERTSSALFDDRSGRVVPPSDGPTDAIDALIRLHVHGEAVRRSAITGLLSAELLTLLETLGLLRADPAEPDTVRASCALYPVAHLQIVSDSLDAVLADRPPPDITYPALSSNTAEFLAALPTDPCERVLDLGAGTGVAALVQASTCARHAWAADITDRATRFAEYNARLNEIENVTVVRGDLYEAVAGLTFDRIVTHPPYMPVPEGSIIFRDGGEDGEQITRRIIAALPDHLRPGGRCYCRCFATDRKEAPLEERVRQMLGAAGAGFDVAVIATVTMAAAEFYGRLLAKGDMTAERYDGQMRTFAALAVENIVICTLAIERHAEPRTALTVRRQLAPGMDPDPAAIDWLLRTERTVRETGFLTRLATARPVVSPRAEIRMSYRALSGELRAERCSVATRVPFAFTFDSSPGLALLLGRCDGSRTVAVLRSELNELGAVADGAQPEEFLQLTGNLIRGGVLEIDELPLPPAR